MQIAIDHAPALSALQPILQMIFPLHVVLVVTEMTELPDQVDQRQIQALLQTDEDSTEFPNHLTVFAHHVPAHQIYTYQLQLAQSISQTLQCCTLSDGSLHGDTDAHFWSIVWDCGVPWLADDRGTGSDSARA
jgi:hypothetical protein